MAERNPIQWPEKFGIGIRYKVSRLNFCLEKLDEKITYLVRVTKAYKEDAAFSSSMIELLLVKMELEDVKKGIDEFLMQYRDAREQNKEEEEGEDDMVMEDLKDFIIKVDKIKHVIDLKIRGLDNEEESSQDLTAKKGGEGEDRDPKRKGLMIDDSASDVMKSHERGESSQARSSTEQKNDGILTPQRSSTDEAILTDEVGKKDGDVREGLLNIAAEAFSLSENETNDVEQQAPDSNGGVQDLEQDITEMKIE